MKSYERMYYSIGVSCAVALAVFAWRVLNCMWLRPKKLEKRLRNLGLNGNSYRLVCGDFKDIAVMLKEANSKPINLSDDIVPRVIPFFIEIIKKYGMVLIPGHSFHPISFPKQLISKVHV